MFCAISQFAIRNVFKLIYSKRKEKKFKLLKQINSKQTKQNISIIPIKTQPVFDGEDDNDETFLFLVTQNLKDIYPGPNLLEEKNIIHLPPPQAFSDWKSNPGHGERPHNQSKDS